MAEHNDFGKIAEDLAAKFLADLGFKILKRNYRFQKAEIDIIAEKEHQIIIAEVKARSSDAFLLPQEAVTKSKIRLLVLAANQYLEETKSSKEVRFDIVSVLKDHAGALKIEHIQDAFDAFDAN